MASGYMRKTVSSVSMEEILGMNCRALDRVRLSRDPRFDGKLFIAITSTRIYCRPICPSPVSKIANVRYYSTAAAAAAAGFRPCLRCRPEAAPGSPAWQGTSAIVRRALRLIDDGVLDEDSVDGLAARVGIGPRHLLRLFLRHVGASPIAVAQTRRLHFAKRLLDETTLSITEIALAAGYKSVRRFNSAFQQTYKRSPRDLRRQLRPGSGSHKENEVVLRLSFRPPYDWDQVFHFLCAQAIPGVERVDSRGYARVVRGDHGHAIISVRPISGEDALELRIRGGALGVIFHIASMARRMFDLAADPASIAKAFKADPLLGELVKRSPGLRIPKVWDPFECAVISVLRQYVRADAVRAAAAHLVTQIGQPVTHAEDGLSHQFPTPADLASADLTGLHLTRACTTTLQALAHAVIAGELVLDDSAEEVTVAFASLPGVSKLAAEHFALRAFDEPDAFPASDPVLRQMASFGHKALAASALELLAETWRPWRAYSAMHLWCAAAGSALPQIV
jgi:AraC family transcriptional regulator of adaptative response / DNA-3-methyladenine glycosylase II